MTTTLKPIWLVMKEVLTLVKAFDTETQAIAGDERVAFGHNLITVTRLDDASEEDK